MIHERLTQPGAPKEGKILFSNAPQNCFPKSCSLNFSGLPLVDTLPPKRCSARSHVSHDPPLVKDLLSGGEDIPDDCPNKVQGDGNAPNIVPGAIGQNETCGCCAQNACKHTDTQHHWCSLPVDTCCLSPMRATCNQHPSVII